MSTPCVVTSSRRVPCCGRARATAPATRPSAARASGRWRSRTRQPGPHAARDATRRGTRPPARARPARAATPPSRTSGRGERHPQPRRVLEAEARPVHQAAFPSRRGLGRRGPQPRLEGGNERAHRGEVALGLLREPLPLRELDAVGRLRDVAHHRQRARRRAGARAGTPASPRVVISSTGAPEPALEVALRHRGEPDVEGAVLAARRGGPRRPARRARGGPRRRAAAPGRRRRAGPPSSAGGERARRRARRRARGRPRARPRRRGRSPPAPGRGRRPASAACGSFGSSETTFSGTASEDASPSVPSGSR